MESLLLASAIGLAVGAVLGWLLGKSQPDPIRHELETELARTQERLSIRERRIEDLDVIQNEYQQLRTSMAKIETQLTEERRAADEKIAMLQNMRESFHDSFKALSSEALKHSNASFLELATASLGKFQEGAKNEFEKKEKAIDEMVKPLRESLEKVDGKIELLEKSRGAAFASLSEQLKMMSESQLSLKNETSNLVKALRAPHTRGRWGEIQLRRVVEMAGMVEHCDFIEQDTFSVDERRLRPDLIVKLPNGRSIVVDSKTPLDAYLDACECADEEIRTVKLQDHARQVRTHLTQLGAKMYWEQFQPGPEFVVLFLPGEPIFGAALQYDPSLIEFGSERKVLMTTPTSLIGLLKVVAYGWRQEEIEEHAKKVSQLGAELYDRIRSMASHFLDMRKSIERTVETYNSAMGALERRVLVSARKFKEYSASTGTEIPAFDPIDKTARSIEIEITSDTAENQIALPPGAGEQQSLIPES